VGYREECAPRKTSGLVARYDTRERGIHETFGKKIPLPTRAVHSDSQSPCFGILDSYYCAGSIILSDLLVGSACITVYKENFTKPVRPGFSQIFH